MTTEEKDLLLKDLCARVPYRTCVCLNPGAYNKPETCILTGVHGEKVHLNVDSDPFRVDHIKPYLRPMSSMTEEERKEIENIFLQDTQEIFKDPMEIRASSFYDADALDWYLKKHFDYRKLIEKGLALEAPEGMYETK